MRSSFTKEEFDVIFDKIKQIETLYGKSFLYIHGPFEFDNDKYKFDSIVIEDVPFFLIAEFKKDKPFKLHLSKSGIHYNSDYINHNGIHGNDKTFLFDNISQRIVDNFKKVVEGLRDAVLQDKETVAVRKDWFNKKNISLKTLESVGFRNNDSSWSRIDVVSQGEDKRIYVEAHVSFDGQEVGSIKLSNLPFQKFLKLVEFLKGE